MTKEKSAAEIFDDNFRDLRNKRLALYGLGKNTETILNHPISGQYHIAGLLDGYRETGLVMGKPVLSYKHALKRKKKIYLTTDMCYSEKQLGSILKNRGIEGYEKIIVSSEYNRTKENGLFEILIHEANTSSILHIGDDETADIESAKKYGLKAMKVASAYDLLNLSVYHELAGYTETLNERILVGLLTEKLFHSPFALFRSNGVCKLDDAGLFAQVFAAPVCATLAGWLIRVCADDAHILFAARDGYLINRVYEQIAEQLEIEKKGSYFLTSRASGVGAMIEDQDDIRFACEIAYSGKPEDFLRKRFDLDLDYAGEVLPFEEQIYDIAKKKRENYHRYLSTCELKYHIEICRSGLFKPVWRFENFL